MRITRGGFLHTRLGKWRTRGDANTINQCPGRSPITTGYCYRQGYTRCHRHAHGLRCFLLFFSFKWSEIEPNTDEELELKRGWLPTEQK
jgi:hypothetical protein